MSTLFQKAYDTNGGANQFAVRADGSVEVMGRDVSGYQKVTSQLLARLWNATLVSDGDVLPNRSGASSDGLGVVNGGAPNNVNIALDTSLFTVRMTGLNVGGHEEYRFTSLRDAQNFKAFLDDFKAAGFLDELL